MSNPNQAHQDAAEAFGRSVSDAIRSRRGVGDGNFVPIMRSMLESVLVGLNVKPESPYSEAVTRLFEKGLAAKAKFQSFEQTIIKSRVAEVFEGHPDVWTPALPDQLHDTMKVPAGDDYVATIEDYESASYHNVADDFLVTLNSGPFAVEVVVRSHDVRWTPNEIHDWVAENLIGENPFVGLVLRLGEDTEVSILEGDAPEGISTYSDEVEGAIEWLTTIEDPEIRKELDEAGLPLRAALLLEGPPGSGKTTLARRVVADRAEGTTAIYPTAGLDASEIFQFAASFSPVMIVLEDVESFFGERGSAEFSEFLNSLDGADSPDGVIVLATTNNSSEFDSAIRRAGRLERSVVIGGVHDGFYRSMLETRLPKLDKSELDVLETRLDAVEGTVTPAIVDSLARSVIMLRLRHDALANFANHEWKPRYQGADYTDEDDT